MKTFFQSTRGARGFRAMGLLAIIVSTGIEARAAYGFYETYAILSINGGGNAYYDAGATTGNLDFQGANFGNLNPALNSLILKGGEAKTFKNGTSDVTGAYLGYRIWTGSPSGSFAETPLGFSGNLGEGGNQQWDATAGNINLLSGLGNGNYTMEIYFRGTGNQGDFYHSNGGINYQASFSVVPEPTNIALGIMGAVGGVGGLLRWRTRRSGAA